MSMNIDQLHLNSWLPELFLTYGNDLDNDFIARRVAKMIPSDKPQGQIMVGGKDYFRSWDTSRNPGAEAHIVTTDLGTPVNFRVENYDLKELIPDELVQVAAANNTPYDPFEDATMGLREALAVRLEMDVAQLMRGFDDRDLQTQDLAGNYAASHFATPSTKWDASGATPFDEIRAAKNQVFTASGKAANTIIIPQTSAEALLNASDYIGKLSNDSITVDMANVLPVLRGMNVLVPRSQYNNAGTITEIWGQDVWIGYIDPSPTLTRTTGFVGMVQYVGEGSFGEGISVSRLEPEDRQASQVWGHIGQIDIVYLQKEAGYLIYDAIT